MTDEQFRETHQPLQVPSSFEITGSLADKVLFALADLDTASAEEIIKHLEKLEPKAEQKPMIAAVRSLLTDWYEQGRLAATDHEGTLTFNLHKITEANDGAVDPDKLAPGLD